MARQFKKIGSKRLVLSAITRLHTYHLECAPAGAQEEWCATEKSCCAKCGTPLRSASAEEVAHGRG